jgi:hypothetical protein
VRLLDSVDACLPHPSEIIQDQAGKALFQLMRSYFPVGAKGPSDRLQKRVVSKYAKEVKTSLNPAATRGFASALGNLPAKLLAPSSSVLDISVICLCRASRPDVRVASEKDAETRRNSLVALARICETVGVNPTPRENECIVGVTPVQTGHVFTALFRGLNDYNMERRGDVGSLSRIVAMQGLVTLATVVNTNQFVDEEFFSEENSIKLVGGILKQLSEKLDAVRLQAGKCLRNILNQSTPSIPYIPGRDCLVKIFLQGNGDEEFAINWADASVTFPLVMKCLDIDELFDYIVSGLVISVGSLTQSVNKQASAALLEWVKESQLSRISRLGQGMTKEDLRDVPDSTNQSVSSYAAFLLLFREHQHDGRVVLPLLKTFEFLMNRMCMDSLFQSDTFSSALLRCLQEEVRSCSDVHRLTSIINVSLGLVTDSKSRRVMSCVRIVLLVCYLLTDLTILFLFFAQKPLALVCRMLMHSFPRVRRIAAESLYVKLLEDPVLDAQDPVFGLLLESLWDADQPASKVKEMAMAVATSLNVGPLVANLESASAEPVVVGTPLDGIKTGLERGTTYSSNL